MVRHPPTGPALIMDAGAFRPPRIPIRARAAAAPDHVRQGAGTGRGHRAREERD